MEKYELAISKLKTMEFSKRSSGVISELVGQLGHFGGIQWVLHPGQHLLRARPNNGKNFNTRNELSYVPAKFNTTYQRCSTPDNTMFYASIYPENEKNEFNATARMIATTEASKLIRENSIGIESITFSRWNVIKDIRLIAICFHEDIIQKDISTNKLNEYYNAQLSTLSDDDRKRSKAITQFLADEFAKKNAREEDYLVSAIFTQLAIQRGKGNVEGIIYPSVRAWGNGYAVAITPDAVDRKIKLIAAGECTIYKNGKTIVDNETVCEISDDSKPFKMEPVSPEFHLGKEKIMQDLGMK